MEKAEERQSTLTAAVETTLVSKVMVPKKLRGEGKSPRQRFEGYCYVQGWAKEWFLGCVNPASWLPLVAGRKFTQPGAHLIAQLCSTYARNARLLARMRELSPPGF